MPAVNLVAFQRMGQEAEGMTKDGDGPHSDDYAVDIDLLREWIGNCDPFAPIDPADERYFDLERVAVGDELVSLRGEDHIEGLYDAIRLSKKSSCQLFSGFRGTGKSTELRRLAHRLESQGYSVLLVDAREYHDLNHPLTIEDLAVITAGAFGEATSVRLGKNVLEESYWKRLIDFVNQEVEVRDLKLPGISDLKIGLKHARPFWLKVRDALSVSPGKLRDSCHLFVERAVSRILNAEKRSQGVVFILDTLERLDAPPGRFREVMDSIFRVLRDFPDFLRLPSCHVVYTVPPYVQLIKPSLRAHYDRVSQVLPAIKVASRGIPPRRYEPGVTAMAELVARRIPIAEIFGDRRDLLETLIVHSGGHVRMLLMFITDLLRQALRRGLPPSAKDVERVIQPLREQARLRVWRDSVLLLDEVLQSGSIEGITEENYATLAHYMDDYLVLCYRNDEGQFEVHPLVREHVRRLAAVMKGEHAR